MNHVNQALILTLLILRIQIVLIKRYPIGYAILYRTLIAEMYDDLNSLGRHRNS
jgi:hypothetical protein